MRPVALLLVLTSVLSAAPDPAAFSSRLLQIYQQADVDAFISLVEVDEATPQEIRAQLRENFVYNARKKATSARIDDLAGDEITSFEKEGDTFAATLKPIAKVIVTFHDHEERPKLTAVSHLVGIKNGDHRIVTAKKQPRPNKTASATTLTAIAIFESTDSASGAAHPRHLNKDDSPDRRE